MSGHLVDGFARFNRDREVSEANSLPMIDVMTVRLANRTQHYYSIAAVGQPHVLVFGLIRDLEPEWA